MPKNIKTYPILSTDCQEFTPPFYIIRDHRKTIKLRQQRELRKKKMLTQKMAIVEAAREEKMNRIQHINRSMLEKDDVWNMVNEEIKIEDS